MIEFTYEDQGENRFLVYEKKAEDVVDTMALGMISNNKIEGIVPFVYVQVDDAVYMKYNISGLDSLQQCFSGVLNRKKFLGILSSLADVMIGAEDYMLELSSFILDSSFIYVDSVTNQVLLVVLPVEKEESSVMEFFRQMVFGAKYDQSENCSYIAALISFFNSDRTFSIYEFKELIQSLQEGDIPLQIKQPVPLRKSERTKQPELFQNVTLSCQNPGEFQETADTRMPGTFQQSEQSRQFSGSSPTGQSYWQQPYQSPQQRVNTGLTEGYNPNRETIVIPGQASDTQAGRGVETQMPVQKEKKGFFGKKEKKPKKDKPPKQPRPPKEKKGLFGKKADKKRDKAASVNNGFGGMAIPGRDDAGNFADGNYNDSSASQQDYVRQEITIPVQDVKIKRYQTIQQDFGETVDLKNYTDDTVLLNQVQSVPEVQPYLYRYRTNQRFSITKELTKIGRSREIVDICISGNSAVGRLHAVLYLQNGRITLQDNDSRNGTYVDEMRLQPGGVPVPLNHGSRIRLGDEELEFRMYE